MEAQICFCKMHRGKKICASTRSKKHSFSEMEKNDASMKNIVYLLTKEKKCASTRSTVLLLVNHIFASTRTTYVLLGGKIVLPKKGEK